MINTGWNKAQTHKPQLSCWPPSCLYRSVRSFRTVSLFRRRYPIIRKGSSFSILDGMSSRAPHLRQSRSADAASSCFLGHTDSVFAEQLAKLLTTNPAAVKILATALGKLRPAESECGACSRSLSSLQTAPPVPASTHGGDELISLEAVKKISGLGKTRIYALVREGRFPAPYKPGGTSSRWSLAEVEAWRTTLELTRSPK